MLSLFFDKVKQTLFDALFFQAVAVTQTRIPKRVTAMFYKIAYTRGCLELDETRWNRLEGGNKTDLTFAVIVSAAGPGRQEGY